MGKPHIEELVDIARELAQTAHGQKAPVYARYAQQYGCTVKTLHGWLNEVSKSRGQRKPRSDKGNSNLTREEARMISALIRESRRETGKQLFSVAQAIDVARANQQIRAEAIDKSTGELMPMSTSAIERAMYNYGCHPAQLMRDAPAQRLRSKHPNHVWEIDPSLCVLYYLPKTNGLAVMPEDEFYKNKPGNIAKIDNARVWRYVISDHTSGWLYVEYVFGAESGENLANVFINAMQYRGNNDPVHGVPSIVLLDPGSANTGVLFKNLCTALGVRVQPHMPKAPRVKGQVENGNNLVERQFEGGLKFARHKINGLQDLNDQAHRWMRVFNGTSIHRRHGMSRYEAWMRIREDQLIKAPDVETCRALTHEKPESRVIDIYLQVSWKGNKYDLGHIEGINNGDKVEVARNPWKPDALRIIIKDSEGNTQFHDAPRVQTDDFGFDTHGPIIGDEYKRHADTPTQKAQKILEKLAMDANTEAEVQGKRKAKAIPFGGRIDPYKPVADAEGQQPAWLEKRGTESPVQSPSVHLRPYTLAEAAKAIRGEIGPLWLPECWGELQAAYPTGEVPADHINDWVAYFCGKTERKPVKSKPALRVVGGAS